MSVFTRGPYGRLAVVLNTLSSINIEIIIIINGPSTKKHSFVVNNPGCFRPGRKPQKHFLMLQLKVLSANCACRVTPRLVCVFRTFFCYLPKGVHGSSISRGISRGCIESI